MTPGQAPHAAPVAADAAAYDRAVTRLCARRPEVIIPGLRRIEALCRMLGDPQDAYEVVHLTGTNGKTSTARMVTALLVAAGLRVGTFTSPHLQDVRERVLLDGQPVDRPRFLAALATVDEHVPAVEALLGEGVTFFEAVTALAALSFRDAAADAGVVEVGKGGRWDATNVHDAAVAVVGRVGLDHPELGATPPEVAAEKAGIIKPGSVAVVGPQPPAAEGVIVEAAAACGARTLRFGADFGLRTRLPVAGGQDLLLHSRGRTFAVHLPLHGAHQAVNAACALAAADVLLAGRGGLPPEAVRAGFARVRAPGRLEVFPRAAAATLVLDGAHNPAGARALVRSLDEAFPGRRIVAVVGVLADKDVAGVLAPLLARADAAVLTRPPCVRAPAPAALAAVASRFGSDVRPDVRGALALADALATAEDVVVVTGSLYLVGAVRDQLGGEIT